MEKKFFLSAHALHKYYNRGCAHEAHVLNDVSLSLPTHGLVCLLGESGSGKTTLLNALGGLDSFQSGEAVVDGRVLRGRMDQTTERVRNEAFGYIFQNYYLLYERTVHENLMLALSLFTLSAAEKEARIDYVLKAVDMARYKKRAVSMLSGGQQQRVAIARALVKSPRVIFADEPTGNLDEANTLMVMGVLKKISASCLVVVATHETRLAAFFADRIISICDGRIVSDRENRVENGYDLSDDRNLYLGEFDTETFASEAAQIELFRAPESDGRLDIRLILARGRVYVLAPDGVPAEIVTARSDVRVLEGKRPKAEFRPAEETDYQLSPLKARRSARLRAGDILAQARAGLSRMGKRMALPVLAMLAAAVLGVIAVSDYMTLSAISKEDFIRTDARALLITLERGETIETKSVPDYARPLLEALIADAPGNALVWSSFNVEPTYSNTGFTQIEALSDAFYGYTYAPLSLLDPDTLLYGRMPESPYEVVIDRWALQNYLDRKTALGASVSDISYFIGQELTIPRKGYALNIVGICDAGNPTLYVDAIAGLSFGLSGTAVASMSMLREAYPGAYDNIRLAENEALVSEQTMTYTVVDRGVYRNAISLEYVVRGAFPDAFGALYVISDAAYGTLLVEQLAAARAFTVFTDDKAAVIAWLNSDAVPAEARENLQIRITDRYDTQMKSYMAARELKLNARVLVTVMIVLLSFVLLYVVQRSGAVRSLKTIAVYRLLGVKKSAITAIFALQTLMLSLFTTVLGSALTAGALEIVSSIESLGLTLVFSWQAYLCTAGALLLMNLVTGLLPICRLLSIPPAQLAARFDL